MANALLLQSPGSWVNLGAQQRLALLEEAEPCSRQASVLWRRMWHWATAELQQGLSGALLFWHLDDVWHFISGLVALRNSKTSAWLSIPYPVQVFSKTWQPIQQSQRNDLVYNERSRKHFYKHNVIFKKYRDFRSQCYIFNSCRYLCTCRGVGNYVSFSSYYMVNNVIFQNCDHILITKECQKQ